MATKSEALEWLKAGYDITPITVVFDKTGHASKKPFLSYATDKVDRLWVLSNWKKSYHIGLVLNGDDFVVFDFDDKKTYEQLIDEHPTFKDGVKEESISGRGVHIYFENNEGLTQVIDIVKGLDVKASKNNYVVVDPETNLEDVTELPTDLWAFYQENKANGRKVVEHTDSNDNTIPELDMITEGFGDEGTRNANMSLLVWTLLTLGFSKSQLYAIVGLANSHSGLSQSEIEKTIDGSWRKWTNGY